jgi:hypothetical protein
VKIIDVRTAAINRHGFSTQVPVFTNKGVLGNGKSIHGGEGCPEMVHNA